MNKILLNFLVVGVSLASIQGASGMDVEPNSQNIYKGRLRSASAKNKENIDNSKVVSYKNFNPKKNKPSLPFERNNQVNQFRMSTKRSLSSESDTVVGDLYGIEGPCILSSYKYSYQYSYFSQEPDIPGLDLHKGLTIDVQDLDFLFADL